MKSPRCFLFTAFAIGCAGCAILYTRAKPVEGEGITSAFHEAHVGRIVFSKEPVDRANPNPAAVADHFTDSDRIYGRFYVRTAIGNHFIEKGGNTYEPGHYMVGVFVDGKPERVDVIQQERLEGGVEKKSTRAVMINPAEDKDPSTRDLSLKGAMEWAKLLKTLPPGTHRIRLEVVTDGYNGVSPGPAAVGEFTVERRPGIVKSGFSFAKLRQGMRDQALEQQALSALQKTAVESGWPNRVEKVKISSDDWDIKRHALSGIVTGRVVSVFGYSKWPDGRCTSQTFHFEQGHNGTDFEPSLRYAGVKDDRTDIDCD